MSLLKRARDAAHFNPLARAVIHELVARVEELENPKKAIKEIVKKKVVEKVVEKAVKAKAKAKAKK